MSSEGQSRAPFECVCGFTAGTSFAWEKHLGLRNTPYSTVRHMRVTRDIKDTPQSRDAGDAEIGSSGRPLPEQRLSFPTPKGELEFRPHTLARKKGKKARHCRVQPTAPSTLSSPLDFPPLPLPPLPASLALGSLWTLRWWRPIRPEGSGCCHEGKRCPWHLHMAPIFFGVGREEEQIHPLHLCTVHPKPTSQPEHKQLPAGQLSYHLSERIACTVLT